MAVLYSALVLTEECRRKILHKFSPAFDLVKCDHITINYPAKDNDKKFQNLNLKVLVVGYKVDNELGVECLVVSVNGRSNRCDGRLYHLTLSLDSAKNAKAVLSNQILADHKYQKLHEPVKLETAFKLMKRRSV